MPLTEQQVIRSILNPVNKKALERAQLDNNRQKYHAGPATDEADAGPYAAVLKEKVRKILDNDDKFKKFESLLSYPLPSSRLIDKGADEYAKAFTAEDRFVDFEFSSDRTKALASAYLDEIKFEDWKQKDLFNQCLRASASVWIVDLPATANAEGYARPQVYLREFGTLTDVGTDTRGNLTSVIFPMSDLKDDSEKVIAKRYAVLDDESYRVFLHRDGETNPVSQVTNYHNLGRVPAGYIWHDKLDNTKPLRIQSPLHALLSDLDWLVIGNVFRQHADLYASFPIFRSYKTRCTYETPSGSQCNNGFVVDTDEDGNDTVRVCPVCTKRKPIGPGTHIEVPQPQGGPDAPDLSDPAGFVETDRELLDYNAEKLEALKADILEYLTGDSKSVDQTKDAVNADQVAARFEARKGILSYWAGMLEQTEYEILWVIFSLAFGDEFLSLVCSNGSEFHLLSPAQAIADYDAARKANLPMYQLTIRRTRIDKLLASGSEAQAVRLDLLAALEPYPDLPLALVPAGSDAWELKANFSQYVNRFERENVSIELFGNALTPDKKISIIRETLYQYVSESESRRQVPEPVGGREEKPSR